jgi:hypothetical protein
LQPNGAGNHIAGCACYDDTVTGIVQYEITSRRCDSRNPAVVVQVPVVAVIVVVAAQCAHLLSSSLVVVVVAVIIVCVFVCV